MKIVTIVCVLAAAVLASLALAQETRPAATQPAGPQPATSQSATTQPSGPKVKVFATLKPGETWAVAAQMTADNSATSFKNKTIVDVLLSVDKGTNDTKTIQAAFKRIRETVELDGKRTSSDSDDSTSVAENKAIPTLTNRVMKMQMEAQNKVVVTKGLHKFVEATIGASEDPNLTPKTVEALDDAFSQILLGGFGLVAPQREVAVGEVWPLRRESLGFLGNGLDAAKEKQKLACKLVSVDKTKDGQIASIEISGEFEIEGNNDQKRIVTYSGYAKVNVERQQLVSAKLEMLSQGNSSSNKVVVETTFTAADKQAATTSAPASKPAE